MRGQVLASLIGRLGSLSGPTIRSSQPTRLTAYSKIERSEICGKRQLRLTPPRFPKANWLVAGASQSKAGRNSIRRRQTRPGTAVALSVHCHWDAPGHATLDKEHQP